MGAQQQRGGGGVRVVLLLLAALAAAHAYPMLFIEAGYANSCTAQPTKPYGAHAAPMQDRAATFTLKPIGGSVPATSLCRGVEYELVVAWGGAARRALLTTSAGRLEPPADAACPGRAVTEGRSADRLARTYTIPCDAKGPSVTLAVTSAASASDAFRTATTTLPVMAAAQCPGSSCAGAPKAAPADAAAAPAAAAVAVPAAAAVNSSASDGGADAGGAGSPPPGSLPPPSDSTASLKDVSSRGCGISSYGYDCVVPAGSGAALHWSLGGSPPGNPCTASASASNRLPDEVGSSGVLHLLLEAPVAGYVGLAFPATKGVMCPADSVIGYVSPSSGTPTVSGYHLTDYSPFPSPSNLDSRGWAYNMGAAHPQGQPDTTLLCFSRRADDPDATESRMLSLTGVNLNWAADSSTSFVPHRLTGSLMVNAQAGGSVGVPITNTDGPNKAALAAAHGALMLAAFFGLMPLGALLARHKWLFGNKLAGGISCRWFQAHRALQSAGALLALASFILALAAFKVSWDLDDPIPHRLYDVHRFLGVVVMALLGVQVVSGFARPGLAGRFRPAWRFGHLALGWTSMALALVVVFVGVKMMIELIRAPRLAWVLPAVLLVVLVLLAAALLELNKLKLERRGQYRAASHTFDRSSVTASQMFKGPPQGPTGTDVGAPLASSNPAPSQAV